jgi:hypothetical protein
MSSQSVNTKEQIAKKDQKWEELIAACESGITAYSQKIKQLRKSLVFLRKQSYSGIPFPVNKSPRHE